MDNFTLGQFVFIKRQIKNCNVDQTIENIKEQLKREDSVQGRYILILNMIIAKMSIQMLRSAISDCNSIVTYESSSQLFFLQGLAYLWLENEKEAIAAWSEGIKRGGPISYFSIMNRLIYDPNARAFFFTKRFDIVEILDFVENFEKDHVFTNSETHSAYSKLRNNSLNDAVAHFSLILAHDPNNAEAIKGRGTAECFLAHWRNAIYDFTTLIKRNIDVEACTKFRAVSFTAIGNYTAAIDDFSTVIAINPFDYHTLSERGRLNMLRKSYKLALEDFNRNPRSDYDDKLYLNFAECYYALGDLPKALEMIAKVSSTNHRSEYCYYLICRDSCQLVHAQKHLLNALTILPCFFLQRTEGDFMYDLGIYDQAVSFYQLALKKKENDSDTYRRYALSLFQSSSPSQALTILKTLHEGWVSQQNEIDLGLDTYHGLAIAGYYQDFHQPTPTEPLLQSASNDLYFIANFMNNYHGRLSSILRDTPQRMKSRVNNHPNGIKDEKNHDFDGIINDFTFDSYEPTPEEIQMMRDAFSLGKRVTINELESTVNQRSTRCYGFCVLYLAYFLRKISKQDERAPNEDNENDDDIVTFKKEPYWRDSIELIRPILTLIDLAKDVRWVLNDQTGDLHSEIAPTFYIQRGEKLSPKYKHAIHIIIRQFNSHLVNQISDIMTFDTIEDVFAVTQDEKTQIRPPFYCRGQHFEGPSISLHFLGTHGFDLFVRPPLDLETMRHYEQMLQSIYIEMINGDSKGLTSLSTFILLLWLYQPLSHYSVELGHIFYHAFILAFCKSESGKFVAPYVKPKTQAENEPELQAFMEMMVTPNESDFATKLINNFKTKKIEPTYSEASISYWEHEPTVDHLYSMIGYIMPK